MPMEMNQRNRECPSCKNPTTFNVDGKEWFCAKCLTSTKIKEDEKTLQKPVETVEVKEEQTNEITESQSNLIAEEPEESQ